MRSLHFTPATTLFSNGNLCVSLTSGSPDLDFPVSFLPIQPLTHSVTLLKSHSYTKPQIKARRDGREEDPDAQEDQVQDLRVPEHWLIPSKALEV